LILRRKDAVSFLSFRRVFVIDDENGGWKEGREEVKRFGRRESD